MPGEYKFIGSGLSEDDIEKASQWKAYIEKERRQPWDGEDNKSEEELHLIGRINDFLAEQYAEVDLQDPPKLDQSQIHILPDEIYPSGAAAYYLSIEDAIYTTSWRQKEDLYFGIIHEAIHAASAHKFHLDIEGDIRRVAEYRGGYQITHPRDKHSHFRGLNEAATDRTAWDIYNKHEKELFDDFGFSRKPNQAELYGEYMRILDIVLDKIAQTKGEKVEDVWRRFKRGMFTGEMMHLRDVERTFGVGSLRLLGALDYKNENIEGAFDIASRVSRYFETVDEKEKNKIAKELLSDDDIKKYKTHQRLHRKTSHEKKLGEE